MITAVRLQGIFQIAWASALFSILLGIAYWLNSVGWHHMPWEFVVPAGFALAGLLQAVTGVPFSSLASQWNSLRPWQRGVLGVGIVLGSMALFTAAALAYVHYHGAT